MSFSSYKFKVSDTCSPSTLGKLGNSELANRLDVYSRWGVAANIAIKNDCCSGCGTLLVANGERLENTPNIGMFFMMMGWTVDFDTLESFCCKARCFDQYRKQVVKWKNVKSVDL